MNSTRRLAACVAAVLAVCTTRSAAQDSTARSAGLRVVTLNDAIRIALEQNSSVRLARNNVTLDSLAIRSARNQFLPNLGLSTQSSQGYLNGGGGSNDFSTSVGLSSGITLYNGRQNINTLREAELTARASGHELGRTRQTTVFTVASDFLALITEQELLRVQQENLTAQQEQLTQLEAFARAGTRNIGDLYQQQAATAAARLAVANARRTTELAKVDLIQELVLDPRQDYVFVTPPPADSTLGAASFNLDSLINVALQQRVDIQAEMLRVEAARREILIAEGGRLPEVSASIGFGTAIGTAGNSNFVSQLDQRRGGSIGVGVSLPIFDRGAVSIAKQRAQVQLENETLALRDAIQGVSLDVRRAYLSYQSALEQLTASDAQQRAAALALEATQARYRVGLATFVEVTLARATLVQARSAVVNARSSLTFQQALMSYYTGVLDASNLRLGR
ncbi:MAG: outer rane efflux protein [Gemmatimonadetes bacterium]|nr:outer rane efflux protein [Gemmatimonadota bacterium]